MGPRVGSPPKLNFLRWGAMFLGILIWVKSSGMVPKHFTSECTISWDLGKPHGIWYMHQFQTGFVQSEGQSEATENAKDKYGQMLVESSFDCGTVGWVPFTCYILVAVVRPWTRKQLAIWRLWTLNRLLSGALPRWVSSMLAIQSRGKWMQIFLNVIIAAFISKQSSSISMAAIQTAVTWNLFELVECSSIHEWSWVRWCQIV